MQMVLSAGYFFLNCFFLMMIALPVGCHRARASSTDLAEVAKDVALVAHFTTSVAHYDAS
jgi:hypothetical protein